ncbi:MFS transporter, OFA family, oxalate/formate antiporter [Salibacterium halotolerans]|uniref:MFS transporter, OFA family, oxalate/formate antiporter n=1 Tax=Salibacterium halotolerans TaxID=1884432 RepID=A0A1I5W2S8_9BACI|nr:MFS transporter, OFA family, oxalate/formate antiporter [Salibacterium halotolerans]
MAGKRKNRWLIALSAVGIHISIGSVYAWSVFTNPLQEEMGWDLFWVNFAFSLAILFLGLSAAFLGRFVEKYGPRVSGLTAAGFFGAGVLGSGLAVTVESLILLLISYGVFGGIGLGIGYITPVSSLVKWFPDRRGLATGLAIMGFGFSAVIFSPLQEALMGTVGIANTFFIIGIIFLCFMTASALYLERPPEGYMQDKTQEKTKKKADLSELIANEAVKTRRFWFLWLMLFINVTCGIAILAVAAPMGEEIAGLSSAAAATMVGIMGFFNGLGRIIWASVSDYIGRANVYTTFFVIQVAAYFMLPVMGQVIVFQILLFIIISCYGGGFASIPAYIGDLFGTKELGAIHGYILTAWAAAGLAGPSISSTVREATQSYTATLYIFGVMIAVALLISFWIRRDINLLKRKQRQEEAG